MIAGVERHQRRAGAEDTVYEALADFDDLLDGQSTGQVPGHFEQGPYALLPAQGDARLELQTSRHLADQKRDQQHDGKGRQILDVAHREREARRHEKEIECRHGQYGGQRPRSATQSIGNEDGSRQEDHDDVGQFEMRQQRGGNQCGQGDPETRQQIVPPRDGLPFGRLPLCRFALAGGPLVHVASHEHDFEIRRLLAKLFGKTALPRPQPGGFPADDHLPQIVFARIGRRHRHRIVAGQARRRCAQILRQFQGAQNARAIAFRKTLELGRFNVDHMPRNIELGGQPCAGTDQLVAAETGADADEQRLLGRPDGARRGFAAVGQDIIVDAVGRAAQGQFPQRQQVALAEEILHGALGLLGNIDLAFLQALQQFLMRQVDENDFVRVIKDVIGQGFPDLDPGNAADDIVQALQMLDIDRREDVDTGRQQFLDILPALGVTRTRRIGMGQFIDENQFGFSGERSVDVEFTQFVTLVLDALLRNRIQTANHLRRFGASMRLDQTDDQIDTLSLQGPGGSEHGIGLADTWAGPEEDLQLAPVSLYRLCFQLRQERIRIGTLHFVVHQGLLPDQGIRPNAIIFLPNGARSSATFPKSPTIARKGRRQTAPDRRTRPALPDQNVRETESTATPRPASLVFPPNELTPLL